NPKKLVKYIGLNPAFDDSGNEQWSGGIGGHGRKDLRCLLIQGAQAILRCSQSPLAQWGKKLGPLELFQYMGLLQPVHFDGWRKGNPHYHILEEWIQVGPEKFQKSIQLFQQWVKDRGLRPIEAAYTRRGPGGLEQLQVTQNGDPEWEKFFR